MSMFHSTASFALAVMLIGLTPGPAMVFLCSQTLTGGVRGGLASILGMHLGGYVHIALASAGIAMLVAAVPAAMLALKLAGAAYLVLIGLRMMASASADAAAPACQVKTLRQGVVVELANPQSALFYLSFLPQFTVPEARLPIAGQMALLGTAANLLFLLAEGLLVALAAGMLHGPRGAQKPMERAGLLGGGAMVGLGVALAAGLV